MRFEVIGVLSLAGLARAHIFAWHKAMYCLNGTTAGQDNANTNDAVNPLYDLPKSEWWFHATNGCNKFPPPAGVFLDLPAGGSFTVEMAENRAFTSLSYGGSKVTAWGDGKTHPEGYSITNLGGAAISGSGCLSSPNLHAKSESDVAGSAFAISYQSDLSKVTPENLVVFSVRYHTPYKRLASFDVPADMPACPSAGCICAWGWVPNKCGQANMYMGGYRCRVTNAKSTVPLAAAKPPVWCENNASACVQGAKQMVYWQQRDGNNIVTSGNEADGTPKSPGYNMKLGFTDGAQKNIFQK
ncbi:hypothetical protein BOTBODRAFT_171020 [Botryobasidium botryosum FD-172 SS1]|uniref:Uncharacterized protein n=1 Tax=Botryobasidium botryosum (strain FD-172 SS1) TaxID=930990 RepID=A0A067MTX7_BOTB1|nr:hypothetical protein BOTBODRAFT_171020 [Botryobasidium botryosum FD-172 SS1]